MEFFDPHADPKGGYVKAPTSDGLFIDSHGHRIFGMYHAPALYSAEERRPVVILCHGMPGQDKNLDLAHALRRAGYFAVTFSYRGVWGSHGEYSFRNLIEDVAAVVDDIRNRAGKLAMDPERICLLGHSVGGFAVLNALADGLRVQKAILMAPCNMSWRWFHEEAVRKSLATAGEKGYYRLSHDSVLTEELAENADRWLFENLVERLPQDTSYHFICGMQDGVCPAETHVKPVLDAMREREFCVSYQEWEDGHAFQATRLHLADVVTELLKENWL